ncbi:MAG: hypothetical protein JW801_03505 [Bacteroidales bacterium]|nr:hypothetical protein [Bacteroidales bacterium]
MQHWTLLLLLAILALGCERTKERVIGINIETGAAEYLVNTPVDVRLTNHLAFSANYFICDQVDLGPARIMKYQNNEWTGEEYAVVCTQMGPSGYYGVFRIGETRYDTVMLFNETGLFRFRYRFMVKEDTLEYDSNEFRIVGLEN